MHFSTVVAALFAATAAAAPLLEDLNPFYPSSDDTSDSTAANQCSETQEAACCNSADSDPALGLECALNILGGSCTGSVQCCDVGGDGGLIALNLCVPISA